MSRGDCAIQPDINSSSAGRHCADVGNFHVKAHGGTAAGIGRQVEELGHGQVGSGHNAHLHVVDRHIAGKAGAGDAAETQDHGTAGIGGQVDEFLQPVIILSSLLRSHQRGGDIQVPAAAGPDVHMQIAHGRAVHVVPEAHQIAAGGAEIQRGAEQVEAVIRAEAGRFGVHIVAQAAGMVNKRAGAEGVLGAGNFHVPGYLAAAVGPAVGIGTGGAGREGLKIFCEREGGHGRNIGGGKRPDCRASSIAAGIISHHLPVVGRIGRQRSRLAVAGHVAQVSAVLDIARRGHPAAVGTEIDLVTVRRRSAAIRGPQ